MPTALELLSTEVCDDILVVDLESRTIIIPKNVSVLGVEADDETRILHFCVPRYYCEVDLSEFLIRINYKNAKNEGDMYIVTDAVIEDNVIKFDWVVGRHAFTKKGNVVFNVCLKDVFEGIVRREFNTTVAILPVLEGLETSDDIVEEHLDIFEQMREELIANIGNDIGAAIDTYVTEHADEIRGEPFEYEDFTAEQLEALRGPKGDAFTYDDLTEEQIQSLKGPKGDTFTYDDLTEEQIQSLKGPKGDTFTYDDLTDEQIQSLKGPQGDAFEYEDFTAEQLAKLVGPAGSSIQSIARTSGTGAPGTIDTYTITLTDGSITTFQVYNGANGEGAGDMTAQVYDPQGKAQDIFKYVDDAVSNIDIPDASGIPNLGENITEGSTNDTVAFWAEKGSGQAWFSANDMLVNQPSQYGFVISYVHDTDVFQMFGDQTNGVTYFRYGDNVNNWFKHWAKVYDDTCDIGSSGIHNLGENITEGSANDTVTFWADKGSGQAWFSAANMLIDQPSEYGFLINHTHTTEIFQIFRRMPDGPTYWRSGNSNGWNGSWAKVYDSYTSDINVEAVNAWGTVSASSDETSMTMYINGIGDGNGNVWIDQAGDAWFKEVHVGSGDDYKKLATEEYVDNVKNKDSGDVTDLLNATSGRYMIGNEVTGMPEDGHWWMVNVFSNNANDTTLVAHRIGTEPKMYIKSAINSTWGEWVRVVIENEYGNASVSGYFTANWLQTTADTHRTDPAEKIAVLDGSGWVYHRTPAEALSDMGGQAKITGKTGQVVGFDANGNPVAQEAPSGGSNQFAVTFDMEFTEPHTVSNQSHTFEEMLAAHNAGKQVIGIMHVKYYGDYYYTANFSYDSYSSGGTFTFRLQEAADMFALVQVTAANAWSGARYFLAYSHYPNTRKLYAGANLQPPDEMLIRNSKLVSTDSTPTVNGEICWTYG